MSQRNDAALRRAARQQLESLAAAGVGQLPKARSGVLKEQLPSESTEASPTVAPKAAAPRQRTDASASRAPTPPLAPPQMFIEDLEDSAGEWPASSAATLEVLRTEVVGCTRCEELACTRTQTVFGVGDPKARLCFMGEAPGADEDRLGEPFVGRAGQLLNKIIEACRMKREDVYILNTLKCRPPGNRNPLPQEAANCRPYLDRQLALIQPEFVCCLGAIAAQNLLGTPQTIGRLRGQIHKLGDIQVVCTYHPAYLLRNPSAKKDTWEDMKLLMRALGTPVD